MNKQILAVLLSLSLILCCLTSCYNPKKDAIIIPPPEYASITTAEELQAIGADSESLAAHYRLENDIALTGEWAAVGTREAPFMGVFDGNGHTISGLTVTDPAAQYHGLFGYAYAATIADLTLSDVRLEGTDNPPANPVAAVAIDCVIRDCLVE